MEAKFQLEEIALEQLNGSVRAPPRQEQGGLSFLAGVLVFVHVGLHQVGHLTGVHLTTLAVTHLFYRFADNLLVLLFRDFLPLVKGFDGCLHFIYSFLLDLLFLLFFGAVSLSLVMMAGLSCGGW